MGFLSSLGNVVSKGLDYLSAPLSQPLTFITQGPTAAAKAVETSRTNIAAGKESGVKSIVTTLVSTAVVGGAILAAAPAAATGAAGSAARSAALAIIPTTPKTIAVTAIAAPVVYGVVKSNPAGAQNAVSAAPSALSNVGENLGKVISNPSVEGVKELIADNPVLVGGAAAAAVIAGGAASAGIIGGVLTRDELQKQTDAFERQAAAAEKGITVVDKSTGYFDTPEGVILPKTEQLKETPAVSTEKAPVSGLGSPKMTQNVKVVVNQRQTKRYINAGVYIKKYGRNR